MKAHIKKTAPLALYYGAHEQSALAKALAEFGVGAKQIMPDMLSQPLGALCGEGGKAKPPYKDTPPDVQMLIMCNFEDKEINRLLAFLREKEIKVPLKAVATKTNKMWSIIDLIKELEHEKAAMEAQNDGR